MDPTTRLDGTDILNQELPQDPAGGTVDGKPNGEEPLNTTAGGVLGGSKPKVATYSKENIITDIEWFLEESNFQDGDPEPADDIDRMQGTEQTKIILYHVQILQLVDALSVADPKEGFLDVIRRNLPIGVELTPKKLLTILHPDRFGGDEDVQKKAHEAFTKLQNFLEWGKPGYIKGTKDTDKTFVEILEDYHQEGHVKATPHLITLYEAFQRKEEIKPQYLATTSDTVKAAHVSLQQINEELQKMNVAKQNPSQLGFIEVSALISSWQFMTDMNEGNWPLYQVCETYHYPSGWRHQPPRAEYKYDYFQTQTEVLRDFLPKLNEFYEKLPVYYFDANANEVVGQIADTIMQLQLDFEQTLATANRRHGLPDRFHMADITKVLPAFCGLKLFSGVNNDCVAEIEHELRRLLVIEKLPPNWSPLYKTEWDDFENLPGRREPTPSPSVPTPSQSVPGQSHTPIATNVATTQNVQTKLLTNGKVILNIPKLSVTKTFRAGYTTSGDRIIALQRIGIWSANFVVETDGLYRIMSYGSAGGKPVLQAAKDADIPFTTNNVDLLNKKIKQGGGYQILFVAVGEWNLDKTTANGNPKIPLVIAGLGFIKPEIKHEFVSRSTLGLVIGSSAAQHELSSAMGGDGDEDILSTMLRKLDIADIENKPHLMRYQNQRSQKLLTYPGPSMTMDAPIYATAWQNMQAPYNFQQHQGLQQGFYNYQQPQQGFQGYQQPQQGFQGYQQPQQGFQGYQQPQQGFQGYQQPQQGFHSYQQPQQGFHSYQQPQQGFQGYRLPQQGFQGYQQPQQGFQQFPQANFGQFSTSASQEADLLKEWSDLSRSLMERKTDLADFSNILKTKVPAILQYLEQTEDGIRKLDKKRFQQFQSYNNKDKQKEVIQEWSRNVRSAPSSLEVGHVLAELHTYAERLGSLQD